MGPKAVWRAFSISSASRPSISQGVFDLQCLPAVDLPGDGAIEGEWNSGGVKVAHPSPDVVPVGHSDFHDSGHGRVS